MTIEKFRVEVKRSRCCGNWFTDTVDVYAESAEGAIASVKVVSGVIPKRVTHSSSDDGKTWEPYPDF